MRRLPLLLAVVLVGLASCGDSGDDDPVGDDRAEQVREAAAEAGLPGDVQDVLALAARSATATFQVTYEADDGTTLVYSQDPPNVRVDTIQAGVVVESAVQREGAGYRCTPAAEEELRCERSDASLTVPGAFTDRALEALTAALAGSRDSFELRVDSRTIAEVDARCLLTTRKPGAPDELGELGTFCVSGDGVQLLVETRGERLEATRYSDEVPAGTFDVGVS